MIVEGVAYCHEQEVMHCDLKPSNILISLDGQNKVKNLYLADFGLSCNIQEFSVDTEFRGSFPYIAPEMLYEGNNFNSLIDSWSLGIILYELFTGKPPF